MAEFKLVIGLKSGKCVQKEAKDDLAKPLMGKKIGDKIAGDAIGFAGYEFELTGGSDNGGFPMRNDVKGIARKKILAIVGTGLKKKGNGIRQRKTVAGNTVHLKTSQINLKVLKEGKDKLDAPAAEAPVEGAAPAEGAAEAPKAEEKPAEKKEEPKPAEKKEAPKEEKKEEPKEEKPAEKKEEPKPEEKLES